MTPQGESNEQVTSTRVKGGLLAGNVITALIASLCCGGSLLFASVGLSGFFSALGLSRYLPQALAAGALSIASLNYFVHRHLATRSACCGDGDLAKVRRAMFRSAAFGVAVMAVSFVLLEWLNHVVVHPERFLTHARYGAALIPGVPDSSLLYALASFAVLALLWAMPFPGPTHESTWAGGPGMRTLRVGVMLAALALLIVLAIDAVPRDGSGNSQHGSGQGPHR